MTSLACAQTAYWLRLCQARAAEPCQEGDANGGEPQFGILVCRLGGLSSLGVPRNANGEAGAIGGWL
jgi:hypothetical protein